MNRRRRWRVIGAAAAAAILAAVVGLAVRTGGGPAVTAAEAARELSLVLAAREEIGAAEAERFPAGERDGWYVPYMEYLYRRGLMDTGITAPSARVAAKALSPKALRRMADGLGIRPESGVRRVTPEVWERFLTEVRGRFDPEGAIRTAELTVYGTAADLAGLPAWTAVSETGECYTFGGFSMDAYRDCRIRVWERDGEIIRVEEVLSREVSYANMLVTGADTSGLTAYFAGYAREFPLPQEVELAVGQIVDLRLREGGVCGVRRKNERLNGRVLAVSEEGAELEGYGMIPFSGDVRFYQTYGKICGKSAADIVVGYDIYDVIAAEGEICAVLIGRSPDAKMIRVLLTDGGGAEKCHAAVRVTSRSGFTAVCGGETVTFAAGEVLTVGADGIRRGDAVLPDPDGGADGWRLSDGRRLTVSADCGELTVLSLSRSFGSPEYPGTLEILAGDGGFYLINETQAEDYLCRVLPSEMPPSYHPEALRAQAVCARSFAVTQLSSSRYRHLGAHVDDTVNDQVYNYAEADERSSAAVRDTYGEVITLDGEIVTAYYYSTSCGYTSDVSLWGEDPAKSPYLKAKRMADEPVSGDIREEEVFRAFITDTGLDDYECGCGWYRWRTEATLEELTGTVNARLNGLGGALASRVRTLGEDGQWREGARTVGRVESVRVTKRGAGGIAAEVEITGTEGTVRVLLQSAIREVLGSADYVYQRIDGSSVSGRDTLASAYFCLEPVYSGEALSGYVFYGGGSGHGVGMSQNCANALGQSGIDAETMLRFFYEGTEITALYR